MRRTTVATKVAGAVDRRISLHGVAKRQFNMRLPERLIERLQGLAAPGETSTSLGARALEEWVRMMEIAGIDFRVTPTGRQPHVTGTGLTVWELCMILRDHDMKVEAVLKNYSHLKRRQIEAALRYARGYGDEMPQGFWGTRPPGVDEFRA